MNELTLFASTFVLVFALGAQSLNVNNGHYVAAALTSFVIGAGQMVLSRLLRTPAGARSPHFCSEARSASWPACGRIRAW